MSPIDLIPDFIPVLGHIDDLIILPALIALSIKLIPQDIIGAARHKAQEEPLQLSKRPVYALFVIILWTAVVSAIILALTMFIIK